MMISHLMIVQWMPQCVDANGSMTRLPSVRYLSIHPFEVQIPAGMSAMPPGIRGLERAVKINYDQI